MNWDLGKRYLVHMAMRIFKITICLCLALGALGSTYFYGQKSRDAEVSSLHQEIDEVIKKESDLTKRYNELVIQHASLADSVTYLNDSLEEALKAPKVVYSCRFKNNERLPTSVEQAVQAPSASVLKPEVIFIKERLPLLSGSILAGHGIRGGRVASDGTNVWVEPQFGLVLGGSLSIRPFRDADYWKHMSLGVGIMGAETKFFQLTIDGF